MNNIDATSPPSSQQHDVASLLRLTLVLVHCGMYFIYFTIRFLVEFFVCDVFGIELFPPNNDDSIAYNFIEFITSILSALMNLSSYFASCIISYFLATTKTTRARQRGRTGNYNGIRTLIDRGMCSITTYATTTILLLRLPTLTSITSYCYFIVKIVSYVYLAIKLMRKYRINVNKVEEDLWFLLSKYITWTRSMTQTASGKSTENNNNNKRWNLSHIIKLLFLTGILTMMYSSIEFPFGMLLATWLSGNHKKIHLQQPTQTSLQQPDLHWYEHSSSTSNIEETEYYTAIIPSCYDGDTCHLEDLQHHQPFTTKSRSTTAATTTKVTKLPGMFATMNVRILGIDAPELSLRSSKCELEQCLAVISKEYLQHILKIRDDEEEEKLHNSSYSRVKLNHCRFDKYGGRITCDIQTSTIDSISNVMIDSRLAIPYSGKTKKTYSWCDSSTTPEGVLRDAMFTLNSNTTLPQQDYMVSRILQYCGSYWDLIEGIYDDDSNVDFDDGIEEEFEDDEVEDDDHESTLEALDDYEDDQDYYDSNER